MKYAVELIEWLDHCSLQGDRGWRDLTDAGELKPTVVQTVGWVISDNNEFVIVVSHVGGEEIDGELCIIKSCITRRKVLLQDMDA